MGFMDKLKKFAGGKNMAGVEILAIGDNAPGGAIVAISDNVITGEMKVVGKQDCVLLQTKYEVILRTQDAQGQWGNVIIASGKDVERRELKPEQVVTQKWSVKDVDIERYLNNQSYTDMAAVVGHPKIKLLVNCIADVEGSPFDPSSEVEVRLGPSKAGPVDVKTTVIERQPAESATFPVTDSILKGTVVVTGRTPCVLTATKYQIRLRLETPSGVVDELVAEDQDPPLKTNPFSVSFGGTNIEFPLKLSKGKSATQTWMVKDLDLPAKLAAHGFTDPSAAADDPRVKLIVKCLADVEGKPDAAATETQVRLLG